MGAEARRAGFPPRLGFKSTTFLRISFGTPSIPDALLVLDDFAACLTSASVIVSGSSPVGHVVASLCLCLGNKQSMMFSILPGISMPGSVWFGDRLQL